MKKVLFLVCALSVICVSGCQSNAVEESTKTIESEENIVDTTKDTVFRNEQESEIEESESRTPETSEMEEINSRTQENNSETSGNKGTGEDRSKITREEWISRILKEEEPRRVMPELSGTDEIIRYIGETGGKAYVGSYNGDTYYLYLSTINKAGVLEYSLEEYGAFEPVVTVIKKKDTLIKSRNFGGRGNEYRVDEDELFYEIGCHYEYSYINDDQYIPGVNERQKSDIIKSDIGWIQFLSGTELIYSFPKPDRELTSTEREEIRFTFMPPEEAKYWYSQNAMNGNWNDFMYYDGSYYNDYFVRVEFTDGFNMKNKDGKYCITVMSSVKDLDTYDNRQYEVLTENYSYNDYSKMESDKLMLEFISDRQAVLTNKETGVSAQVRYQKGYLTDMEILRGTKYYFYEERINEKDYVSDDGTIIRFTPGFNSLVQVEDYIEVGERIVDIYYEGGRSILSVPVQIVDGNTIKIKENSTNTELVFTWSDDNHFTVKGTGDEVPDIGGRMFEHLENTLYTN